jgi:hypothetical protein
MMYVSTSQLSFFATKKSNQNSDLSTQVNCVRDGKIVLQQIKQTSNNFSKISSILITDIYNINHIFKLQVLIKLKYIFSKTYTYALKFQNCDMRINYINRDTHILQKVISL